MTEKSARRPKKKAEDKKKSRLGLVTAIAILLLASGYLAVLELSRPHVEGDRLRYDTFLNAVGLNRVKTATILVEDSFIVGDYVRPDGVAAKYNVPLIQGQPGLVAEQYLVPAGIPTVFDQQVPKRVATLASNLLPALILVVLMGYVLVSRQRGTGLFKGGKGAEVHAIKAEDVKVTFDDVAGQDTAVAELKEIRDFLVAPERFAALGASIPKGVLLYGPPGCGKTLLAKALAGEAGASFYSISGSDFVELYAGVGAARVRELFSEARANAPATIFIDELDSIGRARSSAANASPQAEQELGLNQILAEMDGFSASEGVLVIAATNRPDILDQALLRPGRFDRTIGLERPDDKSRLAILETHAKGKPLAPGVDLAAIANRAFGFTGADLTNVVNEAAILSARAGRETISQVELDAALERMLREPEKQSRLSLRDRSIGKRISPEERVTFADVAGVDDAIEEIGDVRDYLANPDSFAAMGARVPRGILLAGSPGCGKTLLARALAGEANAAFISAAGSDFVEMFVGVGAARVRDLFAEARSLAPAIVFIDEIDAVGARRAAVNVPGQRESDQTLNQILVEMDGFSATTGVIVMAATNRLDILDPALVRPGRFDRTVEISPPTRDGRHAILEVHARKKPMAADVDLGVVAGLTWGLSGADLANVLNEATLLATRRHEPRVTMAMMEEAIDRAMLGVSSRRPLLSAGERRCLAYHEAGHALVALALPDASPPHKITLVPRGGALAHASSSEGHDQVFFSRSMLISRMAVALAGRLAEEIVLGEAHTGSAGDLGFVRQLARRMVCEEALSEGVGLVSHADEVGSDGHRYRAHSEEAARLVDGEVRKVIQEATDRAHLVITTYRDAVIRVAETLLDRETLDAPELERVAALGANGDGARPSRTARRRDRSVL